jgi:hypothetical protein
MSFDEALDVASRDERFMATVYAMNTLLIDKGIYTRPEFEGLFVEWVARDQKKSAKAERPTASSLAARL